MVSARPSLGNREGVNTEESWATEAALKEGEFSAIAIE